MINKSFIISATVLLIVVLFIVFYNNLNRQQKRSEFWKTLKTSGNVTLIPWEFEPAGDNIRERMLTAFVLGVAKHVKTSYSNHLYVYV